MREPDGRLLSIVQRVRTPLALAGVVILFLYLIARQILALPIFSRLGESSTSIVILTILSRLWWLALVALVLGVAAYIVPLILRYRERSAKKTDVRLVDARLDPNDSPYQETVDGNKRVIRPRSRDE